MVSNRFKRRCSWLLGLNQFTEFGITISGVAVTHDLNPSIEYVESSHSLIKEDLPRKEEIKSAIRKELKENLKTKGKSCPLPEVIVWDSSPTGEDSVYPSVQNTTATTAYFRQD